MILRRGDVVHTSVGRIPLGPTALRISEGPFAILRSGGVPDNLAAIAPQLRLRRQRPTLRAADRPLVDGVAQHV